LARNNQVGIETESPRKVTLSVSGVYQNGEIVEVNSRVSRHLQGPAGLYSGHIDVEIANPDGSVATTTGVPTFPHFIKRGSKHAARFSIQMAVRIERGTVVRLSFIRGKHDDDRGCLRSRA
jgi:hypothetical protein